MNRIRGSRSFARLRTSCTSACLALLMGTAALAQKPTTPIAVNLDPATTQIHWTLVTTVHTVHGTFRLKNGSFKVDPRTGEASGQIIIDATSGQSGESARDRHMHREVLESAKYPAITFRPTHVEGSAMSLQAPARSKSTASSTSTARTTPCRSPSTCTPRPPTLSNCKRTLTCRS